MKRIKKIVLVEPRAPGFHVYSRVRLPRLGLPILAALLKRMGYEDVRIYCEDIAPVDEADVCTADFVGISTTTSTALAAYRLGSLVKERNPAARVVLGGVHVTFLPDEPFEPDFCKQHGLRQPVCDHVMRGEAEDLIEPLMHALEEGERPDPILGGALRHNFGERIESSRSIQNLDRLPCPDLEAIVGHERMRVAPVLTSRGCPFDCTFCSVIEVFGQRMRYRSIEIDDPDSVIGEMKRLHLNRMSSVFFYDDNFNAHNRRAKQLLENMLAAGVVPRAWTAQVRASEIIRDRELLDLMRRTHCVMLYLGFESINPESLREFNKRVQVEQIVEAIYILKEYGIRAHGMFVFGADGDTVESLRATADFVIKHNVSTAQFLILTPLPGTRFFHQLQSEGRIFDTDWSRYDAHHTVFWPLQMSPQELQIETFAAMRKIYTWGRVARAAMDRNLLTAFFRTYGHNLVEKHLARTGDYAARLPTVLGPRELVRPVTT